MGMPGFEPGTTSLPRDELLPRNFGIALIRFAPTPLQSGKRCWAGALTRLSYTPAFLSAEHALKYYRVVKLFNAFSLTTAYHTMVGHALRQLGLKDYVTLANAVSGLASISMSLLHLILVFGSPSARPFSSPAVIYSVFFIFLSALFDFLDGKVARNKGSANEFGKQLDSLCDAVSFCAAPAVLVIAMDFSFVSMVAGAIYLCAGLVRLAMYNVQKEKGVYFGLPTPFAAIAVALVAYFAPVLSLPALLVCAVMMLSRFRLRKPGVLAG